MDLDDFQIQIRKTMLPDTFYKPFLCGTTKEFTYLSRLRMGLSGLNAHRKQYHFIDDSTCANCRFRFEDTIHFLLHCPSYAAHRAEMFASLTQFIPNIHLLSLSRSRKDHVFLHDRLIYWCNNPAVDMKLFKIVAIFIKSTNRFSLNWPYFFRSPITFDSNFIMSPHPAMQLPSPHGSDTGHAAALHQHYIPDIS